MAVKDYFSRQSFKNVSAVLKAALNGFINDLALKYSASLAYYTVFALAPLLLLVMSLVGIFWGSEAPYRVRCFLK